MNFIKQENKYGCGIACIAMATNLSYNDIFKLVPLKITDFNKEGITPEYAQSILNELGYRNELRYRTVLHTQAKREDLRYNFADILMIQRGKHFLLSICNWVYDPALNFTESYSLLEIPEKEIISVIGIWNKDTQG